MNVKFTHNMLLDYLETDATPQEIQDYVSLCGPNVETIEKIGDDYVYDVEVTSNRIDAASAFGFALECAAILPRYNKLAKLKSNPLLDLTFDSTITNPLHQIAVELESEELASRVSAVVLSEVTIGPSPAFIQERLKACGISVINNVVDISNYIMIALGQPNHTFDLDKIAGRTMRIRKSKKGEKIMTLDKKEFILPGDDIVIEDGSGTLIDLAGIMGGYNSAITTSTKNVLLCIETYNKRMLRRTSMSTGQRSMAVAYFEKGLDEERVEPALVYGINLLSKYAGGKPSSAIIDVYPTKKTSVTIDLNVAYIRTITNTELLGTEIAELITPLGFRVEVLSDQEIRVTVPSYRAKDVATPADIVEEIARIYGYHNIPGLLEIGVPIDQPLELQNIFDAQVLMREYLRATGYNEQLNYSMISKKLITLFNVNSDDHLHLANTISEDIEFMRTSLIPSLVNNIATNKGYKETMKFFECARIYNKVDNELPLEVENIGLVSTEGYAALKGTVENLFTILKVRNVRFVPDGGVRYLTSATSATILIQDEPVGYIGLLQKQISAHLDIDTTVAVAEVSLAKTLSYVEKYSKYEEGARFARIKRDYTYESSPSRTYGLLTEKALKASPYLLSLDVLSTFQNKVTVRMTFGRDDRNMTEEEAQAELDTITATL